MIKNRNIAPDAGIHPSKLLGAGMVGVGKVFYVAHAADAAYEMLRTQCESGTLFTDIQSALNATVTNRGDYVIVMPSGTDYDITAALTMSKSRVHLICPEGIGWGGMPGNSARIHQNTASTNFITVTADNVEIAGFFFKDDGTAKAPYIIELSGTNWCANIHDNFFGMAATASTSNVGIGGTVANHYTIYDNYFTNYSPGANTGTDNDILAFIAITSTSSTRGLIRNNIMHTGSNTAVAKFINCATAYGIIERNLLVEDKAVSGVAEAGTMTLGISCGQANITVVENRIIIITANNANAVAGMHADQTLRNYGSHASGEMLLT